MSICEMGALSRSICLEGFLISLWSIPPCPHPRARQQSEYLQDRGKASPRTPLPWAATTHQIFYIIVIIHHGILLIGQGQVRLVGAQDHVLPPHRVSQVKHKVLRGVGETNCVYPSSAPSPLALSGDIGMRAWDQGARMSAPGLIPIAARKLRPRGAESS